LCHFNEQRMEQLKNQIEMMSQKGLRILAVAKSAYERSNLPENQHDFDFEFIGLIGFTDPVRESVPMAVAECYRAGIKVVMITGDYPGTAQFIARQIKLKNPEKFITGPELSKIDHLALRSKIKDINIFARVVPQQKLAIVDAFKANGEIVAMTGDGVNDAPALKSSHIGIAMGERGTDVAREASALVLLKDDFSSIVQAVKMGRRIFDNLKKAIAYIFSVHIPIAGISLLPIVFNLPAVLLPAHIAFLELIIDPACSIVFESEKEEQGLMSRPPRDLKQPLFNKSVFILSLLQGLSLLMMVFVVYLFGHKIGLDEKSNRSLAFATIVFGNLNLIIINLSQSVHSAKILTNKNIALISVLLGTLVCLILVLYLPFLRSLFHFGYLSPIYLFFSLLAALVSLIWFDIYKISKNKKISLGS
jgi:P-type Ca2+ transporter type 2C